MTWPTHPLPAHARALLLLPSGHRAFDEEFWVRMPVPRTHGDYRLMHLHFAGEVDGVARALYVLGGVYQPHGYERADRNAPDEVFDQ